MDLILGYIMAFIRWALILVLSALYPQAYTPWVGKAVEVVRADEIKVERNGRIQEVRLYGIDAPISWGGAREQTRFLKDRNGEPGRNKETQVTVPRPQNYGLAAKKYVSRRILDKPVVIQPLPGKIRGPWYSPKIDPYDRFHRVQALMWVHGEKGESLNEELLKNGLAWWYSPFVPFERGFKHLEDQARQSKVGLWAQANPIPPWQWQGTRIHKANPLQKRGDKVLYAAVLAALLAILVLIVGLVRTIVRRFFSRSQYHSTEP